MNVRTCTSTTSKTLLNFKVICQRSKSFFRKWTKVHPILFTVRENVVHNAIFRLSIARSVPEIFAIKVLSCPKSNTLFITQEPLHLACENFTRTSTSTTSRTLLSFKVIGQRSRLHGFLVFFFCVHDVTATRGQYLALTKAWWSSFYLILSYMHECHKTPTSIDLPLPARQHRWPLTVAVGW